MIFLNKVSVNYSNIKVLNNINIQILSNGIYCLFGPNGSGKSSLIKSICGLLKYKGDILLNGKNLNRLKIEELSKKISYVPQLIEPSFNFIVIDIVMMGDKNYSKNITYTNKMVEKANNFLKIVGIKHLREKYINELSGGEIQMVHIARVLNQDTPIILLDEPTNNLDFGNQITLWNLLKKLSLKKIIIASTHDPNYVIWFADIVFILNKGKLVDKLVGSMLNMEKIAELYPEALITSIKINGRTIIFPKLL